LAFASSEGKEELLLRIIKPDLTHLHPEQAREQLYIICIFANSQKKKKTLLNLPVLQIYLGTIQSNPTLTPHFYTNEPKGN
jgi:hypothetical protein